MKQFSRLLSCDLHWETKNTGYRSLKAIVSGMFTIEMTVLEVFGQKVTLKAMKNSQNYIVRMRRQNRLLLEDQQRIINLFCFIPLKFKPIMNFNTWKSVYYSHFDIKHFAVSIVLKQRLRANLQPQFKRSCQCSSLEFNT